MPAADRFRGILAPVLTPFGPDLSPDPERLIRHCHDLLAEGVGLVPFGTTGEGNSLSAAEKLDLLDRLADAGIDPQQMMPSTGCSALTDSVRLTQHAVGLGCRGVLMLPPFYYKNVSDDGLFASLAEVIERVGSDSLRIYLYHIPPVSQVGFSLDLVERLVEAYPAVIAGIKDSSGDWDNTHALIARGWQDFRVFSGSEVFLLSNLRAGGAGCISASANVNGAAIVRLYRDWLSPGADALQEELNGLRGMFQQYPMIAALKACIAALTADPEWERLRPPLEELDPRQSADLIRNAGTRLTSASTGNRP
ncbi:MAG TPA: dihydrodipicolinate synthase family protein [Woeseiaceae bacterium]|jgi:4-hydroxy-tetrahydrodipicolinate synthase|nr:dihydrodipicolinate synthase family protein [Woeseiaceae bacterium]